MPIQTVHIPFDEQLLPVRMLTTGSLTCMYECGNLRYIKCGETEIVRMVYVAVRNQEWQTASYTIENESIINNVNGFSITYTSLHLLNDIQYKAQVTIEAMDNSILFIVKGEALTSFKRNRIGLCVLHPITEHSGKVAVITRPDATTYTARFPDLISPHQPFMDIHRMECAIVEHVKAEIIFEGEVFETEDQRNWSDSSYKTYSTPLEIPFPVLVNKGEIIQQKVQINITVSVPNERKEAIIHEERKIPLPSIGYGRNNFMPLNREEISLLREIPFNHYRVELFLYDPVWPKRLADAVQEAILLDAKLELALFFSDDFESELLPFLFSVEKISTSIYSVLILQAGHKTTPVSLLQLVYKKCKEKWPHLKIGYGTNGFFADLNRHRPGNVPFDFITFSLTPQAHASDTRSLLENLGHQSDIINTARSFAGGKQIHVSPITFKTRAVSDAMEEWLPDFDPRQHTSFGAFWTLSALKNLGGAQCLTFYDVNGYRGIVSRQKNEITLSPLYKLLKEIKAFKPKWIIDNNLRSTPFTEAIVLENEAGDRREYKTTLPHNG